MSGHSKWANIKRKKEKNDAKRSNIFSKMTRLISSAVQEGGGIADPEKNFRLRLAVDRAKSVNMPKETIKRAIEKGQGADSALIKEVLYEGFGPGGSALLISTITDNSNRTLSEIKQALDKNGGKIAGQNSVAYLFKKCGVVELDRKNIDEEKVFMFFDEMQGIDFEQSEESYIIYVPFESIGKVKDVLGTVAGNIHPKTLDVYYVPTSPIEVEPAMIQKIERLTDLLEEMDDVQGVYSNI